MKLNNNNLAIPLITSSFIDKNRLNIKLPSLWNSMPPKEKKGAIILGLPYTRIERELVEDFMEDW